MSTEADLPEDVLSALRANRKIEAIKLLREKRGLGLKEAKERVDAYAAKYPPATAKPPMPAESGLGRLVVIGLVIALAYVGYRFFS